MAISNTNQTKATCEKTPTGYTVLYIKAMIDKELQVSNLEITHPSLVRHEKSNEPRKRIILPFQLQAIMKRM